MKPVILVAASLLALPAAAFAADPEWTGTGELGLAVSRGNSHSENLNTKLSAQGESEQWLHKLGFAAVRAESEVVGDFDGDGVEDSRDELSANRYQFNVSSGYKMNPRTSWVGALRYENDDFAAYRDQTTLSLSFGYNFLDSEQTRLATEFGPGYRRARPQDGGDAESDLIFRGLVDYRHALTGNTSLVNTLLIEAGEDNRFAQNDLGVAVSMNSSFALKAGVQTRYNSEVEPGTHNTDTLTTVNLVYTMH